jgi:hypothetical protein
MHLSAPSRVDLLLRQIEPWNEVYAIPWTVPNADTGPIFSFLTFFLAAGISTIKTLKKITRKSVLLHSKP